MDMPIGYKCVIAIIPYIAYFFFAKKNIVTIRSQGWTAETKANCIGGTFFTSVPPGIMFWIGGALEVGMFITIFMTLILLYAAYEMGERNST